MAKKLTPAKFNFTKVSGMGSAVSFGTKKGEIKEAVGWIVGMKTIEKEYKVKGEKEIRFSHVVKLITPEMEPLEIWGGGSINHAILDNGGTGKAKIKKEFANVLTQFKYVGMLKAKPGQNAGRNIEIAVDRSVKLPADAGRKQF